MLQVVYLHEVVIGMLTSVVTIVCVSSMLCYYKMVNSSSYYGVSVLMCLVNGVLCVHHNMNNVSQHSICCSAQVKFCSDVF